MDTTTTRLLHAEARLAQLEDWRDMVFTRAREAIRFGVNVLLFVLFVGVVHVVGSLEE